MRVTWHDAAVRLATAQWPGDSDHIGKSRPALFSPARERFQMKRFCVLAVLMLLASPACAGESFSFVFGGHHIHIETSRNYRSASCVSVSIPGVYEKHARRDRYDDDDNDTRPTPPPAQVAAPVAA